MMPPVPEAYVAARLAGGPHDGETLRMPWARADIRMVHWEGDELVESLYRLSAPWRGQASAEYRFVGPLVEGLAA